MTCSEQSTAAKGSPVADNGPGASWGSFVWISQYSPRWPAIFSESTFHGYDEGEFADAVRVEASRQSIRFRTGHTQSHDKIEGHRADQGGPKLTMSQDGVLREFGTSEISFFHFNDTRKWPL